MGSSKSETGPVDAAGRITLGFIARAGLVLLALWALANLVWLGRDLLFVVFLAVLVSLFLSLFVDPLERLGVPRAVSAVGVLLIILGGLAGFIVLAWPALEDQFAVIRQQLPEAVSEVIRWVEAQYRTLMGGVGPPMPELQEQLQARLGQEAAGIVAGALPLLNTAVGAVVGLLLVLFGGIYLSIEPTVYARGVARLVPPANRDRVVEALLAAGRALRRWMAGTAVNMVIVGGVTTVGLMALGIPAAIALGIIAGLLEFIPIFGPIIAAVPALAVALIISPAHALWVLLLYLIIQQLESNVITPLVMKGAVELPPALTMFVQAIMAVLFGFLGLLLAVPVLAAGLVLVRRLYVEPLEAAHVARGGTLGLSVLSRGSRRRE